jgi:hypothetical protein
MLQILCLFPIKNIGTTRFFLLIAFKVNLAINICRVHEYLYRLPQYQRIADTITFNEAILLLDSTFKVSTVVLYLISTLASSASLTNVL